MSNWFTRLWKAGEAATHVHSAIGLATLVVAGFSAAVAAMTWVLHTIDEKLPWHGLGVYVLLAIGLVLAILFSLAVIALVSACAYAIYRRLRYPELFQPSKAAPASASKTVNLDAIGIANGIDQKFRDDMTAHVVRLDGRNEGLERTLEATAAHLEQQDAALHREIEAVRSFTNQISELAQRIEAAPWKPHIVRLNELGVTHNQFNESVRERLKAAEKEAARVAGELGAWKNVTANGMRLLIRALRAREAKRFILKPNDEIAFPLGKRLAEGTGYPDAETWLNDYRTWNTAVRTIDNLMIEWTKGSENEHSSLFDLKGYHYGQAPMPPDNIRVDAIIIDYKTVWQVQSSYANQREGFFSFFEERESFPG